MEQIAGFAAPGCHPARAAIDMAAHDLIGKAAGCPVYALLGGAYRTTFELQTQMHGFTPEQQLAVGRYYLDQGFSGLKVKLGGPFRRDGFSRAALDAAAAKLAMVVAELPAEIVIDADANQAFGSAKLARLVVEQALRTRFHPGLALEQPLHHLDLLGHQHLRATLPIPIVLDEAVVSPAAMLQIIKLEAADRIVLKLSRVGGFWQARKIIDLCEAAHIGISLDTLPCTLLGDTALCHLGATIRDPWPADAEGHTFFAETPFRGGIELRDGKAFLPDTPGLGVELDEDRLDAMVIRELAWSG
jgi:L-alanine-DL-glutamate epimerase-like enolase superfamily enzyme